ncbi:MAG TPA: VIT domain-containing protein, partial [Actinopolymorphaceae bacterium]
MTTIKLLETPPTTTADEDSGFGALSTDKGNLPLESLDVRLATTGLAVRTELTQGFRNPYAEPLEATYIFPLPPRAAVTALRMEADDRVVEGVLKEREEARADYDQAIGEGKRASITEEERPGVFTMRVGNILPGELVTVTLTLVGQAAYEDGEATVRFPLVVAPRYIPGQMLSDASVGSGVVPDTDAVPDASRITPPVLLPGFPSPVTLSITADIDPAGLPLAEIASSLHPVSTEEDDQGRTTVTVHPGQRADRDFILRLRLGSGDAVTNALVLVPDVEGDEGTFGLTVLPPA